MAAHSVGVHLVRRCKKASSPIGGPRSPVLGFGQKNMKYTAARLGFVAAVAAIAGVFVALLIYFTLIAALVFLVLATVIAVAMTMTRIKARKGSAVRLESAKVTPAHLTRPKTSEYTNPDHEAHR